MLMGAAREEIPFPEELFPIENYSGIHDEPYVRVMLFWSKTPFAIVCFDVASLRDYAIERFRSQVEELTGIPARQVWACISHTFSVPHLRSREALAREGGEIAEKNKILYRSMTDALERAVQKAMASTEEVKIGWGHAICSVNVNRDIYTSKGWWIGSNDLQDSDKTISLIRVDTLEGKPKAVLYSYDIQSSVMDAVTGVDGTGLISGDVAGEACRYIERTFGDDFVALFLIGTAGDQAPMFKAKGNIVGLDAVMEETNYGEDGFLFVDALGRKLGSQVVQAVENIRATDVSGDVVDFREITVTCPGQKIVPNFRDIHPTRSYTYEEDGEREVTAAFYTLGHMALVGVAPELSSTTGMDIRGDSPYPVTIVATLVNGGEKYMPESSAYDRITYEAMNSKFAKGSAEIFQKRLIDELKDMKGGKKP